MSNEPLIHDMAVGDYITVGQYLWRYYRYCPKQA